MSLIISTVIGHISLAKKFKNGPALRFFSPCHIGHYSPAGIILTNQNNTEKIMPNHILTVTDTPAKIFINPSQNFYKPNQKKKNRLHLRAAEELDRLVRATFACFPAVPIPTSPNTSLLAVVGFACLIACLRLQVHNITPAMFCRWRRGFANGTTT